MGQSIKKPAAAMSHIHCDSENLSKERHIINENRVEAESIRNSGNGRSNQNKQPIRASLSRWMRRLETTTRFELIGSWHNTGVLCAGPLRLNRLTYQSNQPLYKDMHAGPEWNGWMIVEMGQSIKESTAAMSHIHCDSENLSKERHTIMKMGLKLSQ